MINDKYKLSCLLSIVSIENLSIVEGQKVRGIYTCLLNFINTLIKQKSWMLYYCIWLFDLLKIIGYEIDYFSNQNKKYININTLEFSNIKTDKTFIFPHEYLFGNKKICYDYINNIFIIFEYTFINNHLIDYKNKLPINYLNFKKLILNYLNNNL